MPNVYAFCTVLLENVTLKYIGFSSNNLKVPTCVQSITFTYKCNLGNIAFHFFPPYKTTD